MTSLGLLQYSEINESPSINNLTEIEKKRQARHNITIKKRPNIAANTNTTNDANTVDNSENVQNMLKLINNTNGYDDNDDNGGLTDFNPPPRAEVSSKTPTPTLNTTPTRMANSQPEIDYEKPNKVMQQMAESMNPADDPATAVKPRKYPQPLESQEGFGSLPKTYASDFYKQYVPYFNQPGSQSTTSNVNNRDQMLEKLNYMIHLLEDQKDEKTGHVMEEVILYSFLGVFIIFIVDSFARAGKYTR
jgi:hypothetical protein